VSKVKTMPSGLSRASPKPFLSSIEALGQSALLFAPESPQTKFSPPGWNKNMNLGYFAVELPKGRQRSYTHPNDEILLKTPSVSILLCL
jgi:hypothetical protein